MRHATEYLWPGGAPDALGDAPADAPRLTPFLLDGPRPAACVVVFPGGGYGGLAPHEGVPIAEWLNGLGVSAAVLEYRVAPYRHPVPLGDAQRAIRLVRHRAASWRVDPARVGVIGFSAGGHLAAAVATICEDGRAGAGDPVERESSRPDALILCYPVITFRGHCHQGSMTNLLGDDPPAPLRKSLSLETRVTERTPPAFIWHTADDDAVPVENSLVFAAVLRAARVPFSLHVFPHGAHGLALAEGCPEVAAWKGLCAAWLRRLGFAA